MKKKLIWAAFLGLAFTVVAFAAEDQATPRYELKKGAAFQYLLTIGTEIRQQNQEISILRREKWQIHYDIKVSGSKSANGFPLTVTYKAIRYELATPFENFAVDLKAADQDVPQHLIPWAKLVGTSYKVSLTDHVSIDIDSLNITPTETDDAHWTHLNAASVFVQHSFPSLINEIFPVYPETPGLMRTGDAWEKSVMFHNGQSAIPADIRYTISQIAPDTYTAGITGTCALKAKRSLSFNRQNNSSKYSVSETDADTAPDDESTDNARPADQSEDRPSMPQNFDETFTENLTAELTGNVMGHLDIDQKSGLPLNGDYQLALAGEIVRFKTPIPTNIHIKIHYQKIK